jgi:dihydroorotate dehydrogenase
MKPWLFFSPQFAHDVAPLAIRLGAAFQPEDIPVWQPFKWKNLSFPNRLGLAGGVDKDADLIEEWWAYGAGFVEVGTITPQPQEPNPGRIIDRDLESKALWNKMGFPGFGMNVARENLRDLPPRRRTPVFVNIGKNRDTLNDDAVRDYTDCMKTLSGLADAFVVNISSPNTTGLRELLQPERFQKFLGGVLAAKNKIDASQTPVFLKMSPDADDQDLQTVVRLACELGIDGFIATNTTLAREHGSPFPPEGGVSGGPLAKRSIEVLRLVHDAMGPSRGNQLLISAGGVLNADDVRERLALGADLVQVYTALIFEGPGFFRSVARSMITSR